MVMTYDLALYSFIFISIVAIYGFIDFKFNSDRVDFRPCMLISIVLWVTAVIYIYASAVIIAVSQRLS